MAAHSPGAAADMNPPRGAPMARRGKKKSLARRIRRLVFLASAGTAIVKFAMARRPKTQPSTPQAPEWAPLRAAADKKPVTDTVTVSDNGATATSSARLDRTRRRRMPPQPSGQGQRQQRHLSTYPAAGSTTRRCPSGATATRRPPKPTACERPSADTAGYARPMALHRQDARCATISACTSGDDARRRYRSRSSRAHRRPNDRRPCRRC